MVRMVGRPRSGTTTSGASVGTPATTACTRTALGISRRVGSNAAKSSSPAGAAARASTRPSASIMTNSHADAARARICPVGRANAASGSGSSCSANTATSGRSAPIIAAVWRVPYIPATDAFPSPHHCGQRTPSLRYQPGDANDPCRRSVRGHRWPARQ